MNKLLPTSILFLTCVSLGACTWQDRLVQELPKYGHRNWVVIADMAYPWQSGAGIETRYIGGDHLQAVVDTLRIIDGQPHIHAKIYVDEELGHLSDELAPGIVAFEKKLSKELGDRTEALPHEEIIAKLDAAGKLFQVLILKTDMQLPYTSVFLELDCGYWSAEKQQALEKKMSDGE